MYSTAFWCLFDVLLVFWLYCVTAVEGSNSGYAIIYFSYKVSYIFNSHLPRDTGTSHNFSVNYITPFPRNMSLGRLWLVINKVYLLLRDDKLVLRDSIFKLIIFNKVYLLLRDAKLLLRNSIYLQVTGFV